MGRDTGVEGEMCGSGAGGKGCDKAISSLPAISSDVEEWLR